MGGKPEARLRLGTRGSRLALWQAEHVRGLLQAAFPGMAVETVVVRTSGDRSAQPLAMAGGEGLFTQELEQRLLAGEIDLAVHSLKDLPTGLAAGLQLAAVPERGPVEDVLVSRGPGGLAGLPAGARVGTGSPRRRAQLLQLRPDLRVEELRGNVPTRIQRLDEGRFDGLILARAGLQRLGLAGRISEILDVRGFLPAVGQGALGLETRAEGEAAEAVRALDHPPSRAAVEAERSLLRALGGGCQVPLGALALGAADDPACGLLLAAALADPRGGRLLRGEARGPLAEPGSLGERLAADLIARGARQILDP